MYITSVIPYISGVDGVKNFLAGACEFFHNLQIFTKNKTGIYIMVSIEE